MTPTPTPEELRKHIGVADPSAMERALRQRIDQLTRDHAEERAEWNSDRDNYIRDVTMLIEASGAQFDAPLAVADEIRRTRRELSQAIEQAVRENERLIAVLIYLGDDTRTYFDPQAEAMAKIARKAALGEPVPEALPQQTIQKAPPHD